MRDAKLEERWKRLQEVRSEVAKVIERKRERREIGNSLEVEISLFARDREMLDFLRGFGGNLKTVFIVSSVEVIELENDTVPEGAAESEIDGLYIGTSPAPGEKCKRCWKYSPTVGQSKDHPDVCEKCAGVLATYFKREV